MNKYGRKTLLSHSAEKYIRALFTAPRLLDPRWPLDLLPWTPYYRCHLPVCTRRVLAFCFCRNCAQALYCPLLHLTFTLFSTLFKLGLSSASEVFLTGCSAGGLATYLHAGRVDYDTSLMVVKSSCDCLCSSPCPLPTRPPDYVGSILQNVTTLKKFKAASISGFFLLHNTVEGKALC